MWPRPRATLTIQPVGCPILLGWGRPSGIVLIAKRPPGRIIELITAEKAIVDYRGITTTVLALTQPIKGGSEPCRDTLTQPFVNTLVPMVPQGAYVATLWSLVTTRDERASECGGTHRR